MDRPCRTRSAPWPARRTTTSASSPTVLPRATLSLEHKRVDRVPTEITFTGWLSTDLTGRAGAAGQVTRWTQLVAQATSLRVNAVTAGLLPVWVPLKPALTEAPGAIVPL